jgi:hypothetical protein
MHLLRCCPTYGRDWNDAAVVDDAVDKGARRYGRRRRQNYAHALLRCVSCPCVRAVKRKPVSIEQPITYNCETCTASDAPPPRRCLLLRRLLTGAARET